MMKHLIDFMENQKITELTTKQDIDDYDIYVTIEKKEDVEYEVDDDE